MLTRDCVPSSGVRYALPMGALTSDPIGTRRYALFNGNSTGEVESLIINAEMDVLP